jgi:ferredoxin-NADP reductase
MSLPSIRVRVTAIEALTPSIRQVTLVDASGAMLPSFAAGGHIQLTLETSKGRLRNAYSLTSNPSDRSCYRIAVLRIADGRGGSIFVHDKLEIGSELSITPPTTLFPIAKLARRHVLIAGGVGITPFLSHLWELEQQSAPFELHYAARNRSSAAFLSQLEDRLGDRLTFYADDDGQRPKLEALLGDQPLGTHVYTCGPAGLIDLVADTASRLGWQSRYVHSERFGGSAPGLPFTVVLGRSGREIAVDSDTSLLDALEAAECDIPNSCRGGVCGLCETVIIEGEAEHRDHYLTEEVKATHERLMVCVSRARGERIILDL